MTDLHFIPTLPRRLSAGWWVALGLGVALGVSTCWGNDARDELGAELRTAEIERRADSLGWATAFATETDRLEELLADTAAFFSRETARLNREVELLGGRLALAAQVVASMQGQIEATAAVVHRTALPGDTLGGGNIAVPDSITGDVSDGLLSAHVRATVEPPTVAIPSYSVQLAIALGLIDAPDGRQLLTARAEDARVRVSFGSVYVTRPEPIERCGFRCQLKAGGRGYVILRGIEWALSEVIP